MLYVRYRLSLALLRNLGLWRDYPLAPLGSDDANDFGGAER